MMTRWLILATAVLFGTVRHEVLAAESVSKDKPNIVFIMADDLGWMDLACQGNPLVDTPNIDRLAEQGMRFTDAYAAAPVCSPTRAAVLTGQAPARLHITNHIPDRPQFVPDNAKLLPAAMRDRLPLESITIAERLHDAGYTTGFFGKWHLAGGGKGDPAFWPEHQGFELNIGGCGFGGPPSYFDPYRNPAIRDRKAGEYLPDRLADEVIRFMTANRDRPFLVFLWNYAVHWPMEAPAPLLEKYASRKGPGLNDTRYGAMIEALDASIGRIVAALADLNIEKETLLVFTSDNGGYDGVADNRPLRKCKGYLYEGGIRVPLIVRWPGTVAAGVECHEPVISMDFYPTMLALAGLKPLADRPLDGDNILPLLKQTGNLGERSLFFHYPNYAFHRSNRLGSAIRSGSFKLIEWFDDGSLELYDLESDLSEQNNLAAVRPEITAKLKERLHQWRKDVDANMPVLPKR